MTKSQWLPNKYELYEKSVQDAPNDAAILDEIFRKIRRRAPRILREDFCGTFSVACEWVKRHALNQSMALDIDPEPLNYGREHHLSKLRPAEQKRVRVLQKNVISVTTPAADLVAACNFSYWIFKERKTMLRYFRAVQKSLKRDGLFFLDIVGGHDMARTHREREEFGRGSKKFTYIWQHKKFNPLTHEGFFSISYKLASGKTYRDVFTYDWRIWTAPELKDILLEAGFKDVKVYLEKEDRQGRGTGEFYAADYEENCACWIAYIIASKI